MRTRVFALCVACQVVQDPIINIYPVNYLLHCLNVERSAPHLKGFPFMGNHLSCGVIGIFSSIDAVNPLVHVRITKVGYLAFWCCDHRPPALLPTLHLGHPGLKHWFKDFCLGWGAGSALHVSCKAKPPLFPPSWSVFAWCCLVCPKFLSLVLGCPWMYS